MYRSLDKYGKCLIVDGMIRFDYITRSACVHLFDITKQPLSMKLSCCTNMCFFYWKLLVFTKATGQYEARHLTQIIELIDVNQSSCNAEAGQCECLLDISRQLACTKLGSRGKYQPMQYGWVRTSRLLGYLVHTCHLPIDIQQIYCSTQTGQHSRLQHSCCPVWVLQPIHVALMLASLCIWTSLGHH